MGPILKGFQRKDGRVGVRNHVIVLSTVVCANSVVEKISRLANVPGITHANGCIQLGEDLTVTDNIIRGIASHPNVGAVLLVGLGCEQVEAVRIFDIIKDTKPCSYVLIQEEGGTSKAVQKGLAEIENLKREVSNAERIDVPLSSLIIATKCGSSDTTSGLAANPALGNAIDKLVDHGCGALLSETYGLIGCENELKHRAINDEVKDAITRILQKSARNALSFGKNIYEGNPTPGNIAGGITTLTEKSMGAVIKAGSRSINGVLHLGDNLKGKGLWILDTPSQDVLTITSQVAAGAQIVAFTTGRGTPVGNPIAPVIKITGNPDTSKKMQDNIDIDASPILYGSKTIEDVGENILNYVIEIANGKLTRNELLEHYEFALPKVGTSM